MSAQEKMLTIEEEINAKLVNEASKENALNFVAFLRENSITPESEKNNVNAQNYLNSVYTS